MNCTRFSASDPLDVLAFSSPNDWPDQKERTQAQQAVETVMRQSSAPEVAEALEFHWVNSAECSEKVAKAESGEAALFVPLSGGVQPWMIAVASRYQHSRSQRVDKQPACHTQLRVLLDRPEEFVNHLLGTHYVLSFGDFQRPIEHAARFLGLEVLPPCRAAFG